MANNPEAIPISSDSLQPSFSTDSSSDDSSSNEELSYDDPLPVMPTPRRGNFTLRGPGVVGKKPFDHFCIFENKMLLDRLNVIFIKEMVEYYGRYPDKFYIYKLKPSPVKRNSKMEFGESFTKAYLKHFLPNTTESIVLRVSSPHHEGRHKVLIRLGRSKKNAIITTGCFKIVVLYGLEEDGVISFHFWECERRELHLSILHLDV